MKLYRIKRISDGKFFLKDSHVSYTKKRSLRQGYWYTVQPEFNKSGAFFKRKETIKNHLRQLCCDWEPGYRRHVTAYLDSYRISGPHWERLADYEVETLTIIDHGEKTQPAADFMGILETVD